MKIQMSLDSELVKRVDDYADQNYMTRSGLVSVALVQYLNTQDALKALRELSSSLSRVADTGTMSDSDRQSINDFERLAKMLLVK